MMTPSTLDMTDLEEVEETVEVEMELDTQDAEACGASAGEIHDAEGEQQEGESDATETSPSPAPAPEPENLAAWEHDLLARIRKQESRVAVAENEVEWRKESLKEAKAQFEGEVSMLRRLICQRDEKLPLFDLQTKKTESAPEPAVVTEPSATESAPASAPADDSWREVEISSLDIADSLASKLYEASIETIGDLADWQSSGKQLTDIKGVGAAKADKIADAMEAFWKANPQYTR